MRSSGIQLRVGDFLFSIQKRWKLILSLTFVGLMFGLLLSGVTYVQSGLQSFEVTGAFAINTLTNEMHLDGNPNPAYNDFMLPPEMVDAVNYVVQSDHVLNEVINRRNLLGMSPTLLRKELTLTQYNATQIVEMQVDWNDAEEGVDIWNTMIEVANETIPRVLQIGSLSVINEPEAVMVGAGGATGKLWIALTVLGFLSGIGFAVMELLMHPTLTNLKDVETVFGMETIGVIPRDNAYYRRKTSFLVQDDISSSEVVQNFSAAAYILRNRLGTKEKHHCFYVTSATAQEGKSTVAANLAIQLSDMEHRTLLVDFDMRNPRLGSMFLENVDYYRSFNALYSGDATVQEAVTTLTGYLDILPSLIGNIAVCMDSSVVELFEKLKEQYEYIVIDAPPVGEVSGTLSLNQICGTALFVVGYDMATIPEIQSSLDKLDKTGVRVLGCIVNAAQTGKSKGSGKDETKDYRRRKKTTPEQAYFIPNGNEAGAAGPNENGGRQFNSGPRVNGTAQYEAPVSSPLRNAFEESVSPAFMDESEAADTPLETLQVQSAPSPQLNIDKEPAAADALRAAELALRQADRQSGGRRKARGILPLYILLAIPVTALGVAVLAAAAGASLGGATLGFALCANGLIATYQTFTTLADKLCAVGWSAIILALSAALLWLFILMLLRALPAFVRSVFALCRKWCYREEKQ